MTDPLTDAYLDAMPALLAEVRRLRAMEQRVREGEQIASELLAALDGGE